MEEVQTDGRELVQLYVYDLSRGMAKQFGPMLGIQLDGIWHTSIVVGGEEIYYGGGIQTSLPGQTPHGPPLEIIELGYTEVPAELRVEFLLDLSDRYTPEAYSLFHNNCNNFSDELANLLVGTGIPAHITGLPAEVLASPFGQMMAPQLRAMETNLNSRHQQSTAITRQHPPPESSLHPHNGHLNPEDVTQQPVAPLAPAPTPLPPPTVRAAAAALARQSAAETPAEYKGLAPSPVTAAAKSGASQEMLPPAAPVKLSGSSSSSNSSSTTALGLETPGASGLADRAGGISLNSAVRDGGGRLNMQTPARANLDFSTPAPAASGAGIRVKAGREVFEAAFHKEFSAIFAAGGVSQTEAARLALERLKQAQHTASV